MVSWMMVLLLSNPFKALLDAPPRDLASLLDPASALTALQVADTSEDALIALLNAQLEADATHGAGNYLYLKKLMAIRSLEQSKSVKALPALQSLADGPDITLADAARQAIAVINGQPIQRPSGAEILKALSLKLPENTGFVAVVDVERGSRSVPLNALLDMALKELKDNGSLGEGGLPENAFVEMKPQLEMGILSALGAIGNIRLDAAALICPDDIGEDSGYAAFVLKGLFDSERILRSQQPNRLEEREIGGRSVTFVRDGSSCSCPLDPNTFIVLIGPSWESNKLSMEILVAKLTAAEEKAPPPVLQKAFDLVADRQIRVAASGALSESEKALILGDGARNLERMDRSNSARSDHELKIAYVKMVMNLPAADSFNAAVDVAGTLTASAVYPDQAAAENLSLTLTTFDQVLRDRLALQMRQMIDAPPMVTSLMEKLIATRPYWQVTQTGQTVTASVTMDTVQRFVMGMFTARSVARTSAVQRQAPHVAPQPEAPVPDSAQ